jgi:hypothetical protein
MAVVSEDGFATARDLIGKLQKRPLRDESRKFVESASSFIQHRYSLSMKVTEKPLTSHNAPIFLVDQRQFLLRIPALVLLKRLKRRYVPASYS